MESIKKIPTGITKMWSLMIPGPKLSGGNLIRSYCESWGQFKAVIKFTKGSFHKYGQKSIVKAMSNRKKVMSFITQI